MDQGLADVVASSCDMVRFFPFLFSAFEEERDSHSTENEFSIGRFRLLLLSTQRRPFWLCGEVYERAPRSRKNQKAAGAERERRLKARFSFFSECEKKIQESRASERPKKNKKNKPAKPFLWKRERRSLARPFRVASAPLPTPRLGTGGASLAVGCSGNERERPTKRAR